MMIFPSAAMSRQIPQCTERQRSPANLYPDKEFGKKIIGLSAISYQIKDLRQIWLETLFCNSLETLITKAQVFSLAKVK